MSRLYYILFLSLLFSTSVRAQCTMPNGQPDAEMGVIVFNKNHKVMQYCNGDDWIGLWGGNGGGGSKLPTCSEGQIPRWTSGQWVCGNDVEIKGVVQQVYNAGPVATPNETLRDMISLTVSSAGSYLVVGGLYVTAATGYTYHASTCYLYRNGSSIDVSYFYAGIVTGGSTDGHTHNLLAHGTLVAGDVIKITCHQSANAASHANNLKIMLIPVKQ